MNLDPTYLGDGAYATLALGTLVVTANHHDPDFTDSKVYIDPRGIRALVNYLAMDRVTLECMRAAVARQDAHNAATAARGASDAPA